MTPEIEAWEAWEQETNDFLESSSGVVHVGAHIGQERGLYASHGLPVIWIEPLGASSVTLITPEGNSGVFEYLCKQIAEYPSQKAYRYLLTNEDGKQYQFNVANNGCQSSSVYNLNLHRKFWSEVDYVGSVTLQGWTFKTMVEREGIDLTGFDALIMDVQGAELMVLEGMGDHLNQFRWIRAESTDCDLYAGCCQVKDLDAYLIPRGWRQFWCKTAQSIPGVGSVCEVLYQRHNTN